MTSLQRFAAKLDTPVGRLVLVASATHLIELRLPRREGAPLPDGVVLEDNAVLAQTRTQLEEYFQGTRRTFDLPLGATGTAFQQRVWRALLDIPFGVTASYGAVAKTIAHPKASRAVGAANGQNPIAIIVPCHRVIGSNGTLTGYGGGMPMKQWLLAHERRVLGAEATQQPLPFG
jgi:methylated-DNA-[protein]-cysteine S-methyltransferase